MKEFTVKTSKRRNCSVVTKFNPLPKSHQIGNVLLQRKLKSILVSAKVFDFKLLSEIPTFLLRRLEFDECDVDCESGSLFLDELDDSLLEDEEDILRDFVLEVSMRSLRCFVDVDLFLDIFAPSFFLED